MRVLVVPSSAGVRLTGVQLAGLRLDVDSNRNPAGEEGQERLAELPLISRMVNIGGDKNVPVTISEAPLAA
jgi:hypothetical protein